MSHSQRDKGLVTPFAAQLRLAGVDIWLDEWELHPGDSIVGKVSQALEMVDTVLLFWSKHAAASTWVNTEMESALARRLADESMRIIPLRLDDAELPALLRPLLWVSLAEGESEQAVRRILGINTQAELLKRMQQTIEESGLEYRYFHGYGVVVGCPNCGVPSFELEQTYGVDHFRDDQYAGVRCPNCGWLEGGEVW
nr:hypothetical protein KitaXyl93_54840 [Kitasatospora sp. Xyl93]